MVIKNVVPFIVTAFIIMLGLSYYQRFRRPTQEITFSITRPEHSTVRGNLLMRSPCGRMSNILWQVASTLEIAYNTSRKPVFGDWYKEKLVESFPLIENLTFTSDLKNMSGGYEFITEDSYGIYDQKFTAREYPAKNIAISGCLQSYHYFERIEEKIKQLFTVSESVKEKAQDLLDKQPDVDKKKGNNIPILPISIFYRNKPKSPQHLLSILIT